MFYRPTLTVLRSNCVTFLSTPQAKLLKLFIHQKTLTGPNYPKGKTNHGSIIPAKLLENNFI